MSICPRAEKILQEEGIILNPRARALLSTRDEVDQVHWVVNPVAQSILERCINQILAELQGNGPSSITNKSNKLVEKDNAKKPETKKVGKKQESSDDDDIPLDLFGETMVEKKNELSDEDEDEGIQLFDLFA